MKQAVHAIGAGFGGGPEQQQPVFDEQELAIANDLKRHLDEQERDDLWLPECASCALCHGYPLRQQSELTRQLGVCGSLSAIGCELDILQSVSDEPTSEVVAELATLAMASGQPPMESRLPHRIAFPQQKRAHAGRFETRAQFPLKLHRQAPPRTAPRLPRACAALPA